MFSKRIRSISISTDLSVAESTGRIPPENDGFLSTFRRNSDSHYHYNLDRDNVEEEKEDISPSLTSKSFRFNGIFPGVVVPSPFSDSSTYQSFDEIALEPLSSQRNSNFVAGPIGGTDSGFASLTSLASEAASDDTFDPSNMNTIREPYQLNSWPFLSSECSSGDIPHIRLFEFFASSFVFSFGLQNIVEFPLLTMDNGGIAFIIIYIILLLTTGIPLTSLLCTLGQYTQRGFLSNEKTAILMAGLGCLILSTSFVYAVCQTAVSSYSLIYLLGSFLPTLPWTICDGDWNAVSDCQAFDTVKSVSVTVNKDSCLSMDTLVGCDSIISSTALLFWEKFVLGLTFNFNLHRWELVASIGVIWFITFILTSRGFGAVMKFCTFVALVSLSLLTAVLCRTNLMPGATAGIIQALSPSWTAFYEPRTWMHAGNFVLKSVFTAFGVHIVLGSKNRLSNPNVLFESSLVTLIGGVVTVVSSSLVFACIGINDKMIGFKDYDHISFAFVVPAEVFRGSALMRIWSISFYGMLFLLSLGTLVLITESILTSLEDVSGSFTRFVWAGGLCLIASFISLPLASSRGIFVYESMDHHLKCFLHSFIAFIVVIITVWIYGFARIIRSVETGPLSKAIVYIFYPSWFILCPLFFLSLSILNLIFGRKSYSNHPWIDSIGICLLIILLLQLPIYVAYRLIKCFADDDCTIRKLLHPMSNWGPNRAPEIRLHNGSMLFNKRKIRVYARSRHPLVFY